MPFVKSCRQNQLNSRKRCNFANEYDECNTKGTVPVVIQKQPNLSVSDEKMVTKMVTKMVKRVTKNRHENRQK